MNKCDGCRDTTTPSPVNIRIQGNDITTIGVIACPEHLRMMKDILGDFDKALTMVSRNWEYVIDGFHNKIKTMDERCLSMEKILAELKRL